MICYIFCWIFLWLADMRTILWAPTLVSPSEARVTSVKSWTRKMSSKYFFPAGSGSKEKRPGPILGGMPTLGSKLQIKKLHQLAKQVFVFLCVLMCLHNCFQFSNIKAPKESLRMCLWRCFKYQIKNLHSACVSLSAKPFRLQNYINYIWVHMSL